MDKKKLLMICTIVLIFFGIFIFMNYSENAYLLLNKNYNQVVEYLKSGALLMGGVFYLLKFIHIPAYGIYLVSYLLAFLFTVLSIYELEKIIRKYVSNEFLSFIITLSILLNPLTGSIWLTIEKGFIMLSIFASVKAYQEWEKYLEKGKKNFKTVFIWLLLSLISYSTTTNLFIVLSLLPIIRYSKTTNQKLQNLGKTVLICGIPTLIKYIWMILLKSDLLGGNLSFFEKGIGSFQMLWNDLKNGFYLYKPFFLPGMFILLIGIAIYFSKANKKAKSPMPSILFILGISLLVTIIPMFFQNIDKMEYTATIYYSLASVTGIIFVLLNKKIKASFISGFIILLLLVEYISFSNAAINRYIENYKEKDFILNVEERVVEYEESTSQKIEKIALYKNENSKKRKDSAMAMYEYYTKRTLEETNQMDFINTRYFEEKTWDEYAIDQAVVMSGAIHWYLY